MKARRIEGVDGERSDTALGTSWTADQPLAGFARGSGKSAVNDLDEFEIALRTAMHVTQQ
jgi:hypothetical protein